MRKQPFFDWEEIWKSRRVKLEAQVLDEYVKALMGASAIKEQEAKTCVYYAMLTYRLDSLPKVPILALIGPIGTGKSTLLNQLALFVSEPKWVSTESRASLRDQLDGCRTALIDEGDKVDEDLLVRRYSKETGRLCYNRATDKGTWLPVQANIFGATIICRRTPFKDQATASRSIVITTRFQPGNYKITELNGGQLVTYAKNADLKLEALNRIQENWLPLQAIAMSLGDEDWLEYSHRKIEEDMANILAAQGYEPSVAIQQILDSNASRQKMSISEIKQILRYKYDIRLKIYQIEQIVGQMGYRVTKADGYPVVHISKMRKLKKNTCI